jgi:hypothetical protein
MATHDYVIDNQSAPSARSDINNVLQAIVTNNSGTSAPSVTYAGMWWLDTTNNYLKLRDKDNADWVIVGELDVTNDRWKLITDSIKAASAGGIDVLNSFGAKIIDLQVATQATAEAGTNNFELMTPLRTAQAIAKNAVSYPQVITTLTSGTSYTIPSGAQAILIKASGGGGGGSVHANPGTGGLGTNSVTLGGDGGTTTVSNGTLGIAITAAGGSNGNSLSSDAGTANWFTTVGASSAGGDILYNAGASGGRSTTNNFDGGREDGGAGVLVQKYVTGATVGGQVLSYSIGAGGTATTNGGSIQPEAGRSGYIELWIW